MAIHTLARTATTAPASPLPLSAAGDDALERLQTLFERQREAWLAAPMPDRHSRMARLAALADAIRANLSEIQEAARLDFGNRSADETLLTEVMGSLKSITYARKRLRRWMRPRSRSVDATFKPARAKVMPQPRGVVGIMAPWNFPFGLVIKPLISALAAGNRVLIKPSELAPHIAALLERMLGEIYPDNEVAVVQGGDAVARAFAALPFDHLLFTGSTSLGRQIMAAAAPNLTPLTLELGGKSPVIIDDRIDMTRAVKSIATGKLLNAGQVCTAPDYVLVPARRVDEFVQAFGQVARAMYPEPLSNPDYTSIINERHYGRLAGYLGELRELGANTINLFAPAESRSDTRKLLPTLAIDPPAHARILHDEIFGPLLVVVPYQQLADALAYVNARPRPLALYVFSDDRQFQQTVLHNTVSGGVTINDTLLHYTQESLPFGGVGASGFGSYHGDAGFETFSHFKPIFVQSRLNSVALLRAPYTAFSRRLLNLILRIS